MRTLGSCIKSLIQTFPHLHLEDMVPLDKKGNIRVCVHIKNKRSRRNVVSKEQTIKRASGTIDNSVDGNVKETTIGSTHK